MKIRMILAMLVVALGVSSCNNDDDNVVTKYNVLAGVYKGYTISRSNYFSYMTKANENVTVIANDDATVDISFTSDTWGSIFIEKATIENKGSQYVITGNGICAMGHAGATKDYNCSVSASIISSTDATLVFTVPTVMGGLTISFKASETPATIAAACNNNGNYSMIAAGIDMGSVSTSLKMEAAEDGTMTVTLGAFDMSVDAMGMSYSFGNLVMKGMSVAANKDGSYTISGDLNNCTMDMNNSCIEVTGSLEGKVVDNISTCVLTYKPGSMPMNIVGTFTTTESE